MKVQNNYTANEIKYLKKKFDQFYDKPDRWELFKREINELLKEKNEDIKKPSMKEIARNRLYSIKH